MTLDEYFQVCILSQRKDKYRWLIERLTKLNVQVGSIADFGCGSGEGTLALMWELEACEGAGVDIDVEKIKKAQSTLKGIQQMALVALAKGIPRDAPNFLRRGPIEQVVKFYVGDITKRTQLEPKHYDISFCNYVLYHIWLDQGGERSAQKAIKEMARVVRLGGLVAAHEPTQRTGEPTFNIDFGPLFERAKLKPVCVAEVPVECGQNTKYIYSKESAG